MPCPKCGGTDIILAGTYKSKSLSKLKQRQRLKCKVCNATFVIRDKSYKKKIPIKIRKKIIKLHKIKKPYKNKFDNLHKKTYSTREIAKMLNVSKSFVHSIIKKEDKHEWLD